MAQAIAFKTETGPRPLEVVVRVAAS